jgi:hypothetical protein
MAVGHQDAENGQSGAAEGIRTFDPRITNALFQENHPIKL